VKSRSILWAEAGVGAAAVGDAGLHPDSQPMRASIKIKKPAGAFLMMGRANRERRRQKANSHQFSQIKTFRLRALVWKIHRMFLKWAKRKLAA